MVEWWTSLPVWWANAITVMLFVLIAAGTFLVPRKAFMGDAPDQARWRDIRWWALVLVLVQLGIYAIFS